MSRDPRTYKNPDSFDPSRFLGENPELDPRSYFFGFQQKCKGNFDTAFFKKLLVNEPHRNHLSWTMPGHPALAPTLLRARLRFPSLNATVQITFKHTHDINYGLLLYSWLLPEKHERLNLIFG